jgi:hypothetical protein
MKNVILPFRWDMSKIDKIFPYIFKTSQKLSEWSDDHVILMPKNIRTFRMKIILNLICFIILSQLSDLPIETTYIYYT